MRVKVTDLTPEQRAELEALDAMSDDEIDTTDIPENLEWRNPIRGLFTMPPDERRKAIEELNSRRPNYPRDGVSVADTSERGLESIICVAMTGNDCDSVSSDTATRERPPAYGPGWMCGHPEDYDREYCVDSAQLSEFLRETQPDTAKALNLGYDSPTRSQFLARLKSEIAKRGVVDVLRNGVRHRQHRLDLFYATPTPGNETARTLNSMNRFSVTRQLRYSPRRSNLALDLVLFVNGLPVITFELKNSLTKQTVQDAVRQYQYDRDPREELFRQGSCMAHFALDENEARFCTKLEGKSSFFLPFNKGWNDGAGNPPNPNGLKTDYLWKEILSRESLTDIIENYAQLVRTADPKTRSRSRTQIWPRYHQLDVVRKLLADAAEKGAGQRYLVQHSAGSGKSNSIAWLAHRLVGLQREGKPVFDSIIVVTDRRILDRQIGDTIRQFMQVSATVGQAERSRDLREFIEGGKKIIISTVQKFPFILDEMAGACQDRNFAIIIDEAHSSQGGRASSAMARALGQNAEDASDDEDTFEDQINRIIESKKLLPNASYFAFTATPKNKTLELFGAPDSQPDGTTRRLPFHSYTMKQAIQEGFILDVLSAYTPVDSYYNLVKKIEDDPEFDSKKAQMKLRRYVEGHRKAVRQKAEIMVDHFIQNVAGRARIGGQARAMVVTDGIRRAIEYYHAIRDCLAERGSPHRAIVAFSGEHDYDGARVSEASLNGFPSNSIADRIRQDPYRILVCADKFQTGYDEPLLQTMYADKTLSGIKAVQTLSRLNRAHPKKHDVFILDFMNDSDTIAEAFSDYYRTTILSDETDPNRLHDLKADLDGYQVYSDDRIDELARLYIDGADRDSLDPILDACVETYKTDLDEDGQVDFKSKSKGFCRSYAFLCQILPYGDKEWEKLSIFLNFLVPKLPAPVEEDLSKGILEVIDMDSYRVEKREAEKLMLEDEDAEIDPTPASGGGYLPEPEMTPLSAILAEFNRIWGGDFSDPEQASEIIARVPERVERDDAYRNARRRSDEENARIEHDKAVQSVLIATLKCNTEIYKLYTENDSFRRWLENMSFSMTYESQIG